MRSSFSDGDKDLEDLLLTSEDLDILEDLEGVGELLRPGDDDPGEKMSAESADGREFLLYLCLVMKLFSLPSVVFQSLLMYL